MTAKEFLKEEIKKSERSPMTISALPFVLYDEVEKVMDAYADFWKREAIDWMKKANALQNELINADLSRLKNIENFNSPAELKQAFVMGSCQHNFVLPATYTVPNPKRRCIKCGEEEVGNLP